MAFEALLDGYRRFRETRWPEQRATYERLAERGQHPDTLVIACSDSRVDPSVIFDVGPGELFVLRNVANLVPPYEQGDGLHGTSAAIEFAVRSLRVRQILVLGHAQCGGVAACVHGEQVSHTEFIKPWLELMRPALDRCSSEPDVQTALERESIKLSLERLALFPFVDEALRSEQLILSGARFGVADGRLEVLSPDSHAFSPVA